MALIKSISGIRGTIGGEPGDALTPIDIVKFTSAYSKLIKRRYPNKTNYKVVLGRDARISGEMVEKLVEGTLISCGFDVVSAGLATTPTVEMAVVFENADGGIILTASHNPKQWNALKLLDNNGEFLDADSGFELLDIIEKNEFDYVDVDSIGKVYNNNYIDRHIQSVISYPLVDAQKIYSQGYKVVVDSVNSVGSISIVPLLESLGINVISINSEPNGDFAHNPEPLPENLTELSRIVKLENADMGIAVDPDVDRLAFIDENGEPFGEEYTLVAVADYILQRRPGSTVSNLSSSRALKDITEKYGQKYYSSAVGEVNVVKVMKEVNAVIGGEGNGGIIVPDLHYGRDALIGVALMLSHLADKKISLSELKKLYPKYEISKNKIELSKDTNVDALLVKIKEIYANYKITDIDGVKIDFEEEKMWVHLRKSNTEPIIRIYAEAPDFISADNLAKQIITDLTK